MTKEGGTPQDDGNQSCPEGEPGSPRELQQGGKVCCRQRAEPAAQERRKQEALSGLLAAYDLGGLCANEDGFLFAMDNEPKGGQSGAYFSV